MGDTTRRSGRATKGQHSKLAEVEDTPPAPKRGNSTKKSKKNEPTPEPEEEGDPSDYIRCVCGYVEEDDDDERKMISCDQCQAWQHNICMDMSEDESVLPKEYYCEQCHPQDHQKLLDQIQRGEKPWVERNLRREEEEEAQKKGRKKKGKRGGRRGRPSEAQKNEGQQNGAIDSAVEEAPSKPEEEQQPAEVAQTPQTPIEKESNNKRKFPDEAAIEAQSPGQAEPPYKTRKTSTPAVEKPPPAASSRRKSGALPANRRESTTTELQTELVENISDLRSQARQNVAKAMVRIFVDSTKAAAKEGIFNLPSGQKPDEYGLSLGLAVEYALYLNLWGGAGQASDEYRNKFISISHNLKANKDLRDRLMTGALSPNDFTKMTSDQMASKELQEMKNQMMKEVEKQHVLVQEDGPRVRRTHKGEEIVEADAHMADAPDPAFSTPVIRKRASEIDSTVPQQGSPEAPAPESPAAVEAPPSWGAGSPITNQPLSIDTKTSPATGAGLERKSSNNFNIQDVWSGVKGPDPGNREPPRPLESAITPIQQTPALDVKADPEIDQLLKDEEPEDEEPYSPAEYSSEPGALIWHGDVAMAGVSDFKGVGKYVAGADLSSRLPWHTTLSQNLTVLGRIDIDKASEYLCGLRWSKTTDLVVLALTPSNDPENLKKFKKLFDYFTERKRWGVVTKPAATEVKDTYIVPLEAGVSTKPEFVEALEYCTIEDPTPERMLLLTLVVKLDNSPSAHQTPRTFDASSIASPIGQNHNASAMGQHPGFQNSPTTAVPFAPPQPAYPPYANNNHAAHQQPTGVAAARQVLGELAHEPVVEQLLDEAPHSGVGEFQVVRNMFEQAPQTRTDLNLLKQMLEAQHNQTQQMQVGRV